MGRATCYKKGGVNIEKLAVHLTSSSRPKKNLQNIANSIMSSSKNNSRTSAIVVLVIFLLLSQMHPPVTGRSLIPKSEEEKTPDLDSTSLPTFGYVNK